MTDGRAAIVAGDQSVRIHFFDYVGRAGSPFT
jgi:hypothetical protein